jgi:hypothetical protein
MMAAHTDRPITAQLTNHHALTHFHGLCYTTSSIKTWLSRRQQVPYTLQCNEMKMINSMNQNYYSEATSRSTSLYMPRLLHITKGSLPYPQKPATEADEFSPNVLMYIFNIYFSSILPLMTKSPK